MLITKGMGIIKSLIKSKPKKKGLVDFSKMSDAEKQSWNVGWQKRMDKKESLERAAKNRAERKKAKEKYGAQWKKDAREHHIKSREKGEKRRREFPQD